MDRLGGGPSYRNMCRGETAYRGRVLGRSRVKYTSQWTSGWMGIASRLCEGMQRKGNTKVLGLEVRTQLYRYILCPYAHHAHHATILNVTMCDPVNMRSQELFTHRPSFKPLCLQLGGKRPKRKGRAGHTALHTRSPSYIDKQTPYTSLPSAPSFPSLISTLVSSL
jgi:hypothetical protein